MTLRDRILEKARAARARSEKNYADSSGSLATEHLPRVTAAFAYAHLQLAVAVVAQALVESGSRVAFGRSGTCGFRISLGGRFANLSLSMLDESKVLVELVGDYQRREPHRQIAPPSSLAPDELHAWAAELADEIADHLLG